MSPNPVAAAGASADVGELENGSRVVGVFSGNKVGEQARRLTGADAIGVVAADRRQARAVGPGLVDVDAHGAGELEQVDVDAIDVGDRIAYVRVEAGAICPSSAARRAGGTSASARKRIVPASPSR